MKNKRLYQLAWEATSAELGAEPNTELPRSRAFGGSRRDGRLTLSNRPAILAFVHETHPSHALPARFGKYTLLSKIAEGGMAEIFLAVEDTPHTGRRFVIIKRIHPTRADDPDYQDFFLSEGRISIRCAHPNIPQVYELDRIGGIYYLAMEVIRGHTLLEFVRCCHIREEPATVSSLVCVGLGVAAALEHAHSLTDVDGCPLGVIHRDVSPQNILIDDSGTVKLIDFGVARSSVQEHRTRTGVVKGKFSYLAPELLEAKRPPDARVDVFATGVVLYEALTGKPLFRGSSDKKTLANIRFAPIRDLRSLREDVPRGVARVIHTALERDPERRHASASELLQALDDAAADAGLRASRLALRDEVRAVCGDHTPPEAYLAQHGHIPEPIPGLSPALAARDPQLAYFLRQAGAHGEPQSAP